LFEALRQHAEWYKLRFERVEPGWYLFPFGQANHLDPTRPITTIKTAWANARERAGVTGRLHDSRHTLITELAESGAGDQTIMDIAGHVSRQMLQHYSHIRMQAKREALEAVWKKQQEFSIGLGCSENEGESLPNLYSRSSTTKHRKVARTKVASGQEQR
jgi:integrase